MERHMFIQLDAPYTDVATCVYCYNVIGGFRAFRASHTDEGAPLASPPGVRSTQILRPLDTEVHRQIQLVTAVTMLRCRN
uniref:Uncharacterized protein n=1 Tax=Ascaris lumbricoides TaxID=6252 RepID=A0A0M3HNG4_ASCLU